MSVAPYKQQYDEYESESGEDEYVEDGRRAPKRSSGDSGDLGWVAFHPCMICCCCFLVFGIGWSIVEAVASIGFTSCPAAAPGVNSTDGQFLPNHHVLVHNRFQGSSSSGFGRTSYKETNLFNPNVSNATRIGYWRTTKTWYLRSQWAYVLNGGNTPVVVAWQPFFSWMRTFYLKRCSPVEEHVMTQEVVWFWQWGEQKKKWSIADAAGTEIAKSEHSLVYNYGFGVTPNGWNSVVSSTLYPGVVIGTMVQKYNSWWATQSTWSIDVNRTDILKPYVLSFMAATFHKNGDTKND